MNNSAPKRKRNVYRSAEKFISAQIREYKGSGHLIEKSVIVPTPTWPATVREVTAMVEMLQTYLDTKMEYVILVSPGRNKYGVNISPAPVCQAVLDRYS